MRAFLFAALLLCASAHEESIFDSQTEIVVYTYEFGGLVEADAHIQLDVVQTEWTETSLAASFPICRYPRVYNRASVQHEHADAWECSPRSYPFYTCWPRDGCADADSGVASPQPTPAARIGTYSAVTTATIRIAKPLLDTGLHPVVNPSGAYADGSRGMLSTCNSLGFCALALAYGVVHMHGADFSLVHLPMLAQFSAYAIDIASNAAGALALYGRRLDAAQSVYATWIPEDPPGRTMLFPAFEIAGDSRVVALLPTDTAVCIESRHARPQGLHLVHACLPAHMLCDIVYSSQVTAEYRARVISLYAYADQYTVYTRTAPVYGATDYAGVPRLVVVSAHSQKTAEVAVYYTDVLNEAPRRHTLAAHSEAEYALVRTASVSCTKIQGVNVMCTLYIAVYNEEIADHGVHAYKINSRHSSALLTRLYIPGAVLQSINSKKLLSPSVSTARAGSLFGAYWANARSAVVAMIHAPLNTPLWRGNIAVLPTSDHLVHDITALPPWVRKMLGRRTLGAVLVDFPTVFRSPVYLWYDTGSRRIDYAAGRLGQSPPLLERRRFADYHACKEIIHLSHTPSHLSLDESGDGTHAALPLKFSRFEDTVDALITKPLPGTQVFAYHPIGYRATMKENADIAARARRRVEVYRNNSIAKYRKFEEANGYWLAQHRAYMALDPYEKMLNETRAIEKAVEQNSALMTQLRAELHDQEGADQSDVEQVLEHAAPAGESTPRVLTDADVARLVAGLGAYRARSVGVAIEYYLTADRGNIRPLEQLYMAVREDKASEIRVCKELGAEHDACGVCGGDGSSCVSSPCHVADPALMTPAQYVIVAKRAAFRHGLLFHSLSDALAACAAHAHIFVYGPEVNEGAVVLDATPPHSKHSAALTIVGQNIAKVCASDDTSLACRLDPFAHATELDLVVKIHGRGHVLQVYGRSIVLKRLEFVYGRPQATATRPLVPRTQNFASARHLHVLTDQCVVMQHVWFRYRRGLDTIDFLSNGAYDTIAPELVKVLAKSAGPPARAARERTAQDTAYTDDADDGDEAVGTDEFGFEFPAKEREEPCQNMLADIFVGFERGLPVSTSPGTKELFAQQDNAVFSIATDKHTAYTRWECAYTETRACARTEADGAAVLAQELVGTRCGYAGVACFVFRALDPAQNIAVVTGRFVHSNIGVDLRGYRLPVVENVATERGHDVSTRLASRVYSPRQQAAQAAQAAQPAHDAYTPARLALYARLRALYFDNRLGNNVRASADDGTEHTCVRGCGFPARLTLHTDAGFTHASAVDERNKAHVRTSERLYGQLLLTNLPPDEVARGRYLLEVLAIDYCTDFSSADGVMHDYDVARAEATGCHAYKYERGDAAHRAVRFRSIYRRPGNSTQAASPRGFAVLHSGHSHVFAFSLDPRGLETRMHREALLMVAYDVIDTDTGTPSVPIAAYRAAEIDPVAMNPSQILSAKVRITCDSTRIATDRSPQNGPPHRFESCLQRVFPETLSENADTVVNTAAGALLVGLVGVAVFVAALVLSTSTPSAAPVVREPLRTQLARRIFGDAPAPAPATQPASDAKTE